MMNNRSKNICVQGKNKVSFSFYKDSADNVELDKFTDGHEVVCIVFFY